MARLVSVGLIGVATGAAFATPSSGATVTCNKVASPSGSDSARGGVYAPYRTFQKLADSLSAGQTGCLRNGTYRERNVTVSRGGSLSAPLTIRSYPGEHAALVGRLWIPDTADHLTISHLSLDGSTAPSCDSGSTCAILPSPTVAGDDVTFRRVNVTNHHTAICFNAGSPTYSAAIDLTITRSRIHDCGRLPRTNHDHGIYLQRTERARITHNLIYNNADRGIQLYPNAQNTVIAKNVIDGNGTGVQFSGEDGMASSNSAVRRNVIANSKIYNVASWYPSGNPIGQGNVVGRNCLYHGGQANTNSSHVGYTFRHSNLVAKPLYTDGFRLKRSSPCHRVL